MGAKRLKERIIAHVSAPFRRNLIFFQSHNLNLMSINETFKNENGNEKRKVKKGEISTQFFQSNS